MHRAIFIHTESQSELLNPRKANSINCLLDWLYLTKLRKLINIPELLLFKYVDETIDTGQRSLLCTCTPPVRVMITMIIYKWVAHSASINHNNISSIDRLHYTDVFADYTSRWSQRLRMTMLYWCKTQARLCCDTREINVIIVKLLGSAIFSL